MFPLKTLPHPMKAQRQSSSLPFLPLFLKPSSKTHLRKPPKSKSSKEPSSGNQILQQNPALTIIQHQAPVILLKCHAKLSMNLDSFPVPATEFNITQQAPALRVENLNVDVTE